MKIIVAISDTHIGATTGLIGKTGRLDGGGEYAPSKFQRDLWKFWRHFWDVFVPAESQGAEKVIIVLNGDLIDGNHHNTVGVWTNDTDTQAANAVDIFKPLAELGQVYIVRGTEAHSGPGSKSEERIAREIGCKPNETGDYSYWQLWLDVDGVVFQFAHHIGVTSSAAYESSAPMREMVTGLVEAAQWGRPMPHVFVRSHRHRFIAVPLPTENGLIQTVITPGWQLRTPFTERIDRMRMPHIGGVVFRIEDKECQIKQKIYRLPEPKAIRL